MGSTVYVFLTEAQATELADGVLPPKGVDKFVQRDGKNWWLNRIIQQDEVLWAIQETDWVLVDGVPVHRDLPEYRDLCHQAFERWCKNNGRCAGSTPNTTLGFIEVQQS